MSSLTFLILLVVILALVFLIVNLYLAPHDAYQEKSSEFECGFHGHPDQNRSPFSMIFYAFGFLFLIFDLEIVMIYPFGVSSDVISSYGTGVYLIFTIVVTTGFMFELGKNALNIESRQSITLLNEKSSNVTELIGNNLGDELLNEAVSKGINNINLAKSMLDKGDKLNQNLDFKAQLEKEKISNKDNRTLGSATDIIFSFTDISRLYLINKKFFFKFSLHILYTLATLLGIFLFMVMFKLIEVDLFLYFNIFTIVASLVIVSLTYKNKDLLIKLSINSIYVITNMLLLSLILSIFIFIVINFLSLNINTLSFSDCFILSRAIFGLLLTSKLVINTVKLIYDNRKNPRDLFKKLILLMLSLMVMSFFFEVSLFIFNAFNVYLDSLLAHADYIKKPIFSSDGSEKNLNNSGGEAAEIINLYYSLNHHLKKPYPIIVSAKGSNLLTDDGREIFDAASGAAAACIGYGNPEVIEAITNKYSEGTHYLASSYWKDMDVAKLMDWLVQSTGGQMTKVYLTGSGSDAIEAVLKLGRQYFYDQDKESERHIIITRENSYHGNTIGALSASSFIVRQEPYYPILTKNVEHISSCYPYRQLMDGESDAAFVARKAQELDNKIIEIGPKKVMCFLMEPVSGAALGCVPAVPGYLKAMQEVCHKHGVLFILDEIMCGMGRTGTLHSWQDEGVAPDMFVIGKGLGAGYHPISAVLVSAKVAEGLKSEEFIHGLTFDAAPIGAVAALKVQEIIQENNLVDNVSKLGVYLGESLKAKLGDHPNVGNIRGKGFLWGIELVKDKTTKEPFEANVGLAQSLVNLTMSEYNMTIYKGTGEADGIKGDHIMIQPPYNITAKDVDHIVEVVVAVIERFFKEIDK